MITVFFSVRISSCLNFMKQRPFIKIHSYCLGRANASLVIQVSPTSAFRTCQTPAYNMELCACKPSRRIAKLHPGLRLVTNPILFASIESYMHAIHVIKGPFAPSPSAIISVYQSSVAVTEAHITRFYACGLAEKHELETSTRRSLDTEIASRKTTSLNI